MTSMTHARLSQAVYWRRRVFVLGTVIALVLLVVNVVGGGAEHRVSGDVATQVAVDSASGPEDIDAQGPARNPNKGKGQGKNGGQGSGPLSVVEKPPATVLVEPSGDCVDADVAVTPFVQSAVAGEPVTVTLRLRTITAEACTWRVTANSVALKISSDGQEVWSTRECPRQVVNAEVVVRQNVTSTIALTWNARYSDPGCPRQSRYAQPGAYAVQAAALGGEPSTPVDFVLAQP